MKRFWLIAGPSGVGKTTYAFKNVPAVSGSMNFVNLFEIARGLSPLAPALAEREAARIALARAREFIAHDVVFSMETTMSGHVQLGLMQQARKKGMSPAVLYFSVRIPKFVWNGLPDGLRKADMTLPKTSCADALFAATRI